MSVYDIGEIEGIDGRLIDLGELKGQATLVVNVASECGLTPQYEALQRLQDRFGERGFTVLGVPCNQFGEQEPGRRTISWSSARRPTPSPSRWRGRPT